MPKAELAPVVGTVQHVVTRSVNLLAFAYATMLSPLSTDILCMLLLVWLSFNLTESVSHHGHELHDKDAAHGVGKLSKDEMSVMSLSADFCRRAVTWRFRSLCW